MSIRCTPDEMKKDAFICAIARAPHIMADERAYRVCDKRSDQAFEGMTFVACALARHSLPILIPNLLLAARPLAPKAKIENEIGFPSLHAVQDTDGCATSGVMIPVHFVKISLPARVMRR